MNKCVHASLFYNDQREEGIPPTLTTSPTIANSWDVCAAGGFQLCQEAGLRLPLLSI